MKKQTNLYIFAYASIMVIVVAAILSFASIALKPAQMKNLEIEKKLDILRSVNLAADASNVKDKNSYVEGEFDKFIKQRLVVDYKGNVKEGVDAFEITLKEEQAKDIEDRNLPLYVCQFEDGSVKYIIPVLGKGLWGPIWGNIALNEDMNTIYGVTFDHKGETPGLGADINKPFFMEPFKGKQIMNGDKFVSIIVHKGGAPEGDIHGVDAISGGTITSKGLEAMVKTCLSDYVPYFNNVRK
ncbi:MAG: NADH:ubiquinone reductase (Na(+)-transporting) subunit C [Bacteroidales bacterium]|nr:NADH:ubiquinone reductase (Na(+)-transporting) subunit C [Bacteroidales bacterium]